MVEAAQGLDCEIIASWPGFDRVVTGYKVAAR
jgi:hypothetical protein